MEYVSNILNRETGGIDTISLGNWITVTELGAMYGVGPKRARQVLYHMGLLQPETAGRHTKYHLSESSVLKGYGSRNISRIGKRAGTVFDVISPLGQALIADAWSDTVSDMDLEAVVTPEVRGIKDTLEEYGNTRLTSFDARGKFLWSIFHHPSLSNRQLAYLADVEERTIERYQCDRREQIHRAVIDPESVVYEGVAGISGRALPGEREALLAVLIADVERSERVAEAA